jgi:uncharacterized cupredoxin-like copper-binding protein
MVRTRIFAAAAVGAALFLAAGGAMTWRFGLARSHDAANTTVVGITEEDFKISAPTRLPAGDVTLRVHNRGPDRHEMIVVREADGPLPLRSDNLTLDEDALESVTAGTLEPGEPGGVRDLQVHLDPGRYVLFCNMSGHYLGGMQAEVVVP